MILIDYKETLTNLLFDACSKDILSVAEYFADKSVFSYVIYCDDGMESFGGAAGSREGIEKHRYAVDEKAYLYAETFAAEWNYINDGWEYFRALNQLQDYLNNSDYDGELTGVYQEGDFNSRDYALYDKFYFDLIVDVLKKLKAVHFNAPPFEQDILLGLQYGDPSIEARKFLIEVSKNINSPEWHEKMLNAYNLWI